MKITLLLSLLFITSCASYVRTAGTRMISPEANGGLGHGSLELRLQTYKRDKLDFSDDRTDNAIDREDSPYSLSAMGDIGFFERLDLFVIPSLIMAPTIWGVKYQIIGDPRIKARAHSFSTSLVVGYGDRKVSESNSSDLEDFFDDNIDKISVNTTHQEIGIISGYRWSEKFLHYANAIYLHENLRGKVTTDNNTLNDAKFRYQQDGMIYSTGFILYFAKAHWKVDYSHFVSDWTHTQKQTVNSLNTALGFDW